jgi:NADH-quinone oxidoreductase subunit E
MPSESRILTDDLARARLTADAQAIIERYPVPRSALLPMLHLVQSEEGFVSPDGIAFCAEQLGLTTAEVAAVATFYTQYKRHPNGTYTVGVCINTLCAVMGGDEIFRALSEHMGIGHDETTADGAVTLEEIECNAACDYAPVVMVNWEFFDNQTPESARDLVDQLRAGETVRPTRGADSVCTFKQMSRVLAGFNDGRAYEGVGAGPATLEGLRLAKERGWTAPESDRRRDRSAQTAEQLGPVTTSAESTARGGVTSSHDSPPASPDSDRGGTTAGKPPADATDGTDDSGRATTPRPQSPGPGATPDGGENDGGSSPEAGPRAEAAGDAGAARKDDDTPGDGAEG